MARTGFGENLFCGSQNNTPDETDGVNNAALCYNEENSSVFPLLWHYLPVGGAAMNFINLTSS